MIDDTPKICVFCITCKHEALIANLRSRPHCCGRIMRKKRSYRKVDGKEVITVRLSKIVKDDLMLKAHDNRLSLNEYCIRKLQGTI